SLRIDLRDRPEEDEVVARSQRRQRFEQREIHSLVDHAEEADARTRNGRLIDRLGKRASCLLEVLGIDAARERVDARMVAALCFEEAVPAREDDVRLAEQLALSSLHETRGAMKPRQLVHAVVDDAAGTSARRMCDRHRRVEPEERMTNV